MKRIACRNIEREKKKAVHAEWPAIKRFLQCKQSNNNNDELS